MHKGYCWACLAAATILGCAAPRQPISETDMLQTVRSQLAAENPDSDAALILSQALSDAQSAGRENLSGVLDQALQRAQESREFTPPLEAPLPEGWPRPSLPGLIRIKSYPAVRAAWVRNPAGNDRLFMTLFNHIKDRQIAMTAPVVMGYPDQPGQTPAPAAEKPARDGAKRSDSPDSMAFLYRRVDQDAKGQFGPVQVEDERPLLVVSVALTGSYREKNFQKASAILRDWLEIHKEWAPAGAVRVLAYNSPFMPFWRKYSEVQIPVRPAGR